MKRAIAIVIALIVCAGAALGGWIGYREYKVQQLREAVTPHVKNATLRLDDVLATELASSAMTYAELFRKIEEHVKQLDNRSIDLRSMDAAASPDLVASADRYVKWTQEVMRRHAAVYREQLQVNNAEEWFDRSLRNSGASDYALRSLREDSLKVMQAYDKAIDAETSYGALLSGVEGELSAVRGQLDARNLVDEATVVKVRDVRSQRLSQTQHRAKLRNDLQRKLFAIR